MGRCCAAHHHPPVPPEPFLFLAGAFLATFFAAPFLAGLRDGAFFAGSLLPTIFVPAAFFAVLRVVFLDADFLVAMWPFYLLQ
jgi:hypothetical protein